MNINHTKMTLEINSCKNYEILEVRQGDKGSRIIDFAFTVNGETVNLTSTMSAKVNATVDDVIVADSVAAVIDTNNNVVIVTLTDTMLALSGICKMDIVLTEGDEIITAETVCLRVGKSVINDDSKAFPGTSSIVEITKEVENARGSSNSLGARLDTVDANLTKKADKTNTLAGYGIINAYTKTEMLNLLASKADKTNTLAGYGIINAYTKTEMLNLLASKADKSTTLAGYGISDAYTKTEADDLLGKKADKADVDMALTSKANLVNSPNIFDFDTWAKGLQSLPEPVKDGTLDKVDYNEKSISFTTTEIDAFTSGWTSLAPQSMRIAVKPNTKYLFSWLPSSTNCGAYVFLNGVNTSTTRFLLKSGFGSFTTAEDTTYILIRFNYNGVGFFKASEIMITEKESIYLPNIVAEGVPEVANEVLTFEKTTQTSLDGKYDSSNVEVGKGELTPAQATYDGCEGSFNYSKIGKTVTVALNITTLVAGKNYVQFAGLPFTAMTASKLSSIVAYTTANKLVNIRLHGSWLYISSPGTTFAEGEKINVIVTYIIG